MTTQENNHRKHGKTVRAKFGEFGRFEISILGTPCSEIKKMADIFIDKLGKFKIAYADADHKTGDTEKSIFLQHGAQAVYTNKISFQRFDFVGEMNKFQRNAWFNEYDLILVNGNHFNAEMQIVVVDDRKPLEKKLDKITNPLMIILSEGVGEIPEYLKNHLADPELIPVYSINELSSVASVLHDLIILNTPPLYGLVLAGGRSERMGHDKGLIDYHGKPQREYLIDLADRYTEKTFMSGRPDQADEFAGKYAFLPDSISGLGPYGAMLSAFREHPDHAWLVIACDLPLLSEKSLDQLINGRNPSKVATAFYNPVTDLPEPLITIWEPKGYPALLQFLGLGFSCPRKALINSNAEIIENDNPDELMNVNNTDEKESVMKRLMNMH